LLTIANSHSTIAEFVWYCKTITSLSIMAAQTNDMEWGMLSLLWVFFITSDSWQFFNTGLLSPSFKNTKIFCLLL
jgi:hypothetical protein